MTKILEKNCKGSSACKFCRSVVAFDGMDELLAARHIVLCKRASREAKAMASKIIADHPDTKQAVHDTENPRPGRKRGQLAAATFAHRGPS